MRTIALYLVFVLTVFTGCNQPNTSQKSGDGPAAQKSGDGSVAPTSTPKRTKAEFRESFKKTNKWGGLKGTISEKAFLAEFGKPDRSRTQGDDTYWTYACKDGTIEVHITLYGNPQLGKDGLNVVEINDH